MNISQRYHAEPTAPRLLRPVHEAARTCHLSVRTEKAYAESTSPAPVHFLILGDEPSAGMSAKVK